MAVATLASSPSIIRTGQYIIAGPIPANPANREPKNPIKNIIKRFLVVIYKSPSEY